MTNSSLYNGQNLDFTGNKNPYGLIQNAGKGTRRKRRGTRSKRNKSKKNKSKKNKSKKNKSKKSRRSNKRTRKHRR